MIGQKAIQYGQNDWGKLMIWKNLSKYLPNATVYADQKSPYYTVQNGWSGTTKSFLRRTPWLVRKDHNFRRLFASWFVQNENKLPSSRIFLYICDDMKLLSNNSSTHIQSYTTLLSINSYFCVQDDSKLQSIVSPIYIGNNIGLEQRGGRRELLKKDTRDALSDRSHWKSTEMRHSERPRQVHKLWPHGERPAQVMNNGRTAKELCKVYEQTQYLALSVVCNDAKLRVKTSVGL